MTVIKWRRSLGWGGGHPCGRQCCRYQKVGWLGLGCVSVVKVSVAIISGILWGQNVKILVWFGENALGCPWGIRSSGKPWWDGWARRSAVLSQSQWYANGSVLIGRSVFLLESMGWRLGGLFWDLLSWVACRGGFHGSGGELWRCYEWQFLKGIVWRGEKLLGNQVLFAVECHL